MPERGPSTSPESFLPVKPVELLILAVLAEGDRHGYALRQDIIALSDGTIELEAANLYRHIRGLDGDGLIHAAPRRSTADDDPRRRYFRLTPLGRRVLVAESARLRGLLRFVERHALYSPAAGR